MRPFRKPSPSRDGILPINIAIPSRFRGGKGKETLPVLWFRRVVRARILGRSHFRRRKRAGTISPTLPSKVCPPGDHVAFTPRDRELLKRCLHHETGAWNDFVDRFLGLIYHVIQHTADARSYPLTPEDTEDLAATILLEIVDKDYAVLRHFRGQSSLASYLTVVARRTCVNEMARRIQSQGVQGKGERRPLEEQPARARTGGDMETVEEINALLAKLPSKERAVVKLYFLEGRSYEEISTELDIPVNSIGPILNRARKKLRGEESSPA